MINNSNTLSVSSRWPVTHENTRIIPTNKTLRRAICFPVKTQKPWKKIENKNFEKKSYFPMSHDSPVLLAASFPPTCLGIPFFCFRSCQFFRNWVDWLSFPRGFPDTFFPATWAFFSCTLTRNSISSFAQTAFSLVVCRIVNRDVETRLEDTVASFSIMSIQ